VPLNCLFLSSKLHDVISQRTLVWMLWNEIYVGSIVNTLAEVFARLHGVTCSKNSICGYDWEYISSHVYVGTGTCAGPG
jgi:hypothetical protein